MTTTFNAFRGGVLAAATIGISFAACAQAGLANSVGASTGKSGDSFIGIAVGKPQYGTACGNVAGLTCSNNGTSYSLTAGNMFTDNLGLEITALDLGRANRANGSVSARALNISAVGRLPLGQSFALEGKVGTTYGVTHVHAPDDTGVASGRARGFGLGYGVALDVDVARGIHGAVGWEQHDMHFVGQGMQTVKNITVGLGYRF